MKARRVLAPCLAAILALPLAASAQEQDLASAAEKEKERRKKAAAPAATYTDKDLPASTGTASPKPGATAAPSPSPAAGETRQAARDEAYWRGRATGLRNAIVAAEQRVKKAEEDYAAARRPGSQPLPSDVVTQEGGLVQRPPDPAFNPEANRLQKELEDAKAALAQAQKALSDFEEEARKAGALPGWLR